MSILITGGLGYIGSHTSVEMLNSGYDIVIIDNLLNSKYKVNNRIKELTDRNFPLYIFDLRDRKKLREVFKKHNIEAVIHFAGLKAVGESVQKPLEYYQNNILSTIVLCEVMGEYQVKNFVFSSSATVYGVPELVPIKEDFSLQATNPYGRTKLMIEEILEDLYISDPCWSIALLRYFNPIGAHPSGRIGEDPNGIPNNLMPYITQVAIGKLPELQVFGNDYPTKDGTGVRDYIHVVDLAKGHVKALEKILTSTGLETYNLGTGKGYSVLELIATFEKVSGIKIPYVITERRSGDVAEVYADPSKAREQLNWEAEKGIEDMCADAWRWQSLNPNGYN
ncbi:MAG: UDP-glucose 4-epimerase GalE [Bacillaceae bacterium]|nr:UDP-glucose 4-epimerase GalE [Bacillaceae bacterium]